MVTAPNKENTLLFVCARWLSTASIAGRQHRPMIIYQQIAQATASLGQGRRWAGRASSTLYKVATVNDTLAYAVGEIYLKDSSGQWDHYPYNLATWNGSARSIQKVSFYCLGQSVYSPMYSIIACSADDFRFEAGIHQDGTHLDSISSNTDFIAIASISNNKRPQKILTIRGKEGIIKLTHK